MTLRDYQTRIAEKGLKILTSLHLVYLSMQTRTGKTITALEIARRYGKKTVLFVTKKKAIPGIEKDVQHFPSLEVTVVNFESVHKVSGEFDLVIIDEAHSLGQYPKPSKRYQDLKQIANGLPCILLSATPSPESFSQLYHQFTINGAHSWSQYKNFYRWADDHVIKRERLINGYRVADYSQARQDLIEADTAPYMISLTQSEAGIEQQVRESVLLCDMSPRLTEFMLILNRDGVLNLDSGATVLGDTPAKLMNKVQQISSGTVLDEDGQPHILDRSKAEFIRQQFSGQKIAVFYKFKAELAILKSVFPDHTEIPEQFQAADGLTFLAQFQSGREGIRLDTADAIVFYNIDYSFLSYEQAKNRLVSKERTKDARLFWVFNRAGIEPEVHKVVTGKSNFTTFHFKNYAGAKNTTASAVPF